jgi:hypothetical protein
MGSIGLKKARRSDATLPPQQLHPRPHPMPPPVVYPTASPLGHKTPQRRARALDTNSVHARHEGGKTSCSPQKILDSPSYVFVPHPMSLFPVACLCSPWGGWIPHAACISLKTAPNNMKLVSMEREKLDLQYYVIKN